MNNTRMMASRSELEGAVSTLQVDLELFTDTGGTDRAMCSALRHKMADLTRRWEGVTKDFTTTLANDTGRRCQGTDSQGTGELQEGLLWSNQECRGSHI